MEETPSFTLEKAAVYIKECPLLFQSSDLSLILIPYSMNKQPRYPLIPNTSSKTILRSLLFL